MVRLTDYFFKELSPILIIQNDTQLRFQLILVTEHQIYQRRLF